VSVLIKDNRNLVYVIVKANNKFRFNLCRYTGVCCNTPTYALLMRLNVNDVYVDNICVKYISALTHKIEKSTHS